MLKRIVRMERSEKAAAIYGKKAEPGFSIFTQSHFPFHLSAIKATFIKTSNLALRRQR